MGTPPGDSALVPPRGFTFVNVTYPGELPLLRLQARSMARFLPPALVTEVLNVVNATDEIAARDAVRRLGPDYGPLEAKVRTLTASEVFATGPGRAGLRHSPRAFLAHNPWLYGRRRAGWRGNDGWQMQQALKLAAARMAAEDTVVILDSKNIFVAPLVADDFVSPSGRPRGRFDRGRSALADRWLPASLRALGFDARLAAERPVLSILTPAVVTRTMVRAMLARLESRRGPVEGVFAMPWNRVTEFMLITAWCLNDGGLARHFDEGAIDPWNLNLRHDEELKLRHVAGAVHGKVVTPHRLVMMDLSPDLRASLLGLLAERGLVDGAGEFDAVVAELRGGDGTGGGL